jgi:hypothetical protein
MRKSVVLTLLFAAALSACAQQQTIVLGHSTEALTGPWKFSPGDSPWVDTTANGHFLWSEPGFDDSSWHDMNLTPPPGSSDPAYGSGGYLPGWRAQGYPYNLLWGWYRLRIHIGDPKQMVALLMPQHVDDGYQVYANGEYLGELGRFSRSSAITYRSRPLVFTLPRPGAGGDIELAIRVFQDPVTSLEGNSPDNGGLHGTPLVGTPATIHAIAAQQMHQRIDFSTFGAFVCGLVLLVALAAFWIWILTRESVWLWLVVALVMPVLADVSMLAGMFGPRVPQDLSVELIVIALALDLNAWIVFWWKWFHLGHSRGFLPAQFLTGVLYVAVTIELIWLPWHLGSSAALIRALVNVDLGARALLGAALLAVGALGLRKDRTEGLLAILPMLLLIVADFQSELLQGLRINTDFFPFGISVSVGDLALLLMVLMIGVLAARRFVSGRVAEQLERQSIARELEQARILQQQVLIPEPVRTLRFRVEADYRPAQTVGGDFYQALARDDGGLLVVLGDVSGKGVSASMLVAVMVGAIRSESEHSFAPQAILSMLNRRMIGRSGGHFATCLAAEIAPDGTMQLANAGHLPPYLNGREVILEGSLPLGFADNAEYPVQSQGLQPGDRLTFISDGVVEAINSAKELFGFDRTRAISTQSAEQIAAAAQAFGQQDDITVLTLQFAPAEVLHA